MDKRKKIWSIVLLCVQILLVVCMVICTFGVIELFDEGEDLVQTSGIGWLLVMAALAFVIPIVCGFLGSIGFVISLANVKIAQSKAMKIVSICFSVFYGLVLLACALFFIQYGVMML